VLEADFKPNSEFVARVRLNDTSDVRNKFFSTLVGFEVSQDGPSLTYPKEHQNQVLEADFKPNSEFVARVRLNDTSDVRNEFCSTLVGFEVSQDGPSLTYPKEHQNQVLEADFKPDSEVLKDATRC
jgi:hypothetical protein